MLNSDIMEKTFVSENRPNPITLAFSTQFQRQTLKLLLPGTAAGTVRRRAVTVASPICGGDALVAWL